jgi:peptidyl-prolyl cis-trans isomerase C
MGQRRRRLGLFGAFLVGLLLSATPAVVLAQDTEPAEDPTVAVVDGTPILHSEVTAYAATLPQQYQQAFDQIFPFLVQRLIDLALIDKAAKADGLTDDEVVQERVARLTLEVMREVYMERLLAAAVSDEEVEARYQAFLEENPPAEEIRARHILLETEEEARQVIASLDEGADFAELAEERSTGPSSAQGGDLGYFTGEQMVPSFAEAAFALELGSYTSDPVQTEFGWHVILLEDKRPQDPPSLEKVAPQLTQELQGAAVESHIAGLRTDAEIEVMESAQPATEDPAMEESAMEESATEESATEESATEESAPEESAPEESATEEASESESESTQ